MKFCEEGQCAGIAATGNFCPLHSDPVNRKERNAPRHAMDAWYRRREWRGVYGVRGMKIRRNPICEFVETDGTHCTRRACDVHHTRPWKDTEDWFVFLGGIDMEFLQSLCKRHHSGITMHELMFGPDKKLEK